MFDLEYQIAQWRSQYVGAMDFVEDDIAELESHLRDTIADLSTKGLDEEESFVIATRRLGRPEDLVEEFEKVNGVQAWKGRSLWILCGYVGGTAFAGIIAGFSTSIGALGTFVGFGGTIGGIGAVLLAAFLWGLLFFSLWKFFRRTSVANVKSVHWLPILVLLLLTGQVFSRFSTISISRLAPLAQVRNFFVSYSFGMTAINVAVLGICIVSIYRLAKTPVDSKKFLTS